MVSKPKPVDDNISTLHTPSLYKIKENLSNKLPLSYTSLYHSSTVVEYSTHDLKSKGSEPATERKR